VALSALSQRHDNDFSLTSLQFIIASIDVSGFLHGSTCMGEVMSKLSLGAIVLLSSPWMLAVAGASSTDQNPTSRSTESQQSQTATIEGCVSGIVDSFVLTDAKGKTYDLTGGTVQLAGRVGHKVRVLGEEDKVDEAEMILAGGPLAAFRVEKVHSLSATCK
jgi:hypothetical protein